MAKARPWEPTVPVGVGQGWEVWKATARKWAWQCWYAANVSEGHETTQTKARDAAYTEMIRLRDERERVVYVSYAAAETVDSLPQNDRGWGNWQTRLVLAQ